MLKLSRLIQLPTNILLVALLSLSCQGKATAAENLRLREGLSFIHDVDKGFPIIADKFDDVKVEAGKATFIFFGAAGDLNTNRQARRVVDLYKKLKDSPLKFIILDVDHVSSAEAKQLLKNYYQGYIPDEVILDKQGKTSWSHVGEIDLSALATQLDKVVN
jgi:hypothetical protein